MNSQKPMACLCPVCKKHPLKPRCGNFISTCPPKPPEPDPCALTGMQAQLINTANPLLQHGERVKFDTILSRQDTSVEYDPGTGLFTLTKEAGYLVNWNVSVHGSQFTPHIRLALQVDGVTHSAFTMPISVGVISGSALVAAKPGASLALVNDTNDTIRLDTTAPIANITIVA